nr:hypothetical protein GCM10020092_076410 [Actinoplanes digitatis]
MPHLWLRHETRQTERRTAITAVDAERLVRGGATVTVEESPQRVDEIERYRAAGCRIVPAAGWFDAPDDVVVVGLKELPVLPAALRHRHVYFGHAYKNQEGAPRAAAPVRGRRRDAAGRRVPDRRVRPHGWPRSATGPDIWAPR